MLPELAQDLETLRPFSPQVFPNTDVSCAPRHLHAERKNVVVRQHGRLHTLVHLCQQERRIPPTTQIRQSPFFPKAERGVKSRICMNIGLAGKARRGGTRYATSRAPRPPDFSEVNIESQTETSER